MSANGWFQIGLFVAVVFLATKPLGVFMVRVFERQKTWLDFILRPVEKLIYRLAGVDETREMGWTEYGFGILVFSGVSMLLLYLFEREDLWVPFYPETFANVAPGLAWH